jgi:hypothetical protein
VPMLHTAQPIHQAARDAAENRASGENWHGIVVGSGGARQVIVQFGQSSVRHAERLRRRDSSTESRQVNFELNGLDPMRQLLSCNGPPVVPGIVRPWNLIIDN